MAQIPRQEIFACVVVLLADILVLILLRYGQQKRQPYDGRFQLFIPLFMMNKNNAQV